MEIKLKTNIVSCSGEASVTIPEGTILKVVEYGRKVYTGSSIVYDKVLLTNDEYTFYLSLQAFSILTEEIKTKK